MQKTNKKYIYRSIFLILSITVATIIFIFSSQDGEQSNTTSRGFMKQVVNILPFTKYLDEIEKARIIEDSQTVIRKIAHFSIYTVLGINVMGFFKTFEWNTKKQVIFTLSLCIIYAISDEIHQFFSDGRAPLIKDVFIDGFGSLFGTIIVLGMINLTKKYKKVRKNTPLNSWKIKEKWKFCKNANNYSEICRIVL